MTFGQAHRLHPTAQEALAACADIREAGASSITSKFELLLEYRAAVRRLRALSQQLEGTTEALLKGHSDRQLQLWAVNQEHNAVFSEIEHLKRREFKFLDSLSGLPVVGELKTGTSLDRDYVVDLLEQEATARSRLSSELNAKKEELEGVKRRLEEQRAEKRKLQSLVGAVISSQSASALLEELQKYRKQEAVKEVLSTPSSIFESLCEEDKPTGFPGINSDSFPSRKEEELGKRRIRDALIHCSIPPWERITFG